MYSPSIKLFNLSQQDVSTVTVFKSNLCGYSEQSKTSCPTIKRTYSSMTDKKLKTQNNKEFIINSNFTLEEHQEPESAETDFNSPTSFTKKNQTHKALKNTSFQNKNNFPLSLQINQSIKQSFFDQFEEIAEQLLSDIVKNNNSLKNQIIPLSQSSQNKQLNLQERDKNIEASNKQLNKSGIAQKKQIKLIEKRAAKSSKQLNNSSTQINQFCSDSISNHSHSLNVKVNYPIKNKFLTFVPSKEVEGTEIPSLKHVYAEEIYLKSITLAGSIKLQKFPCFKESDLSIPPNYSQLIQKFSDDDKSSSDELLEKAVNYIHKKLIVATLQYNPVAIISDAQKIFTMRDIKIDRNSDDDDEEQSHQECYNNSNNQLQNICCPYNNTNFLSEDEDDDNSS